MKAEHARLKRLQRLERVRDIAKQAAAAEAAKAEGTLAQLLALAERTRRLADDYGTPGNGPTDGWFLTQHRRFGSGLEGVRAATLRDAERARAEADAKLAALGQAERRRAAVGDRAEAQERRIAKTDSAPSLGARRRFGTVLD